jgi:capsular polysaccharide biosynthesis protein
MSEENIKTLKLVDLVNLVSTFFKRILINAKLVLVLVCSTTIISVIAYLLQKPNYEANASFILTEASASGGGLSSLGAQFGIDITGLTGKSGLFAGDNILDILKSRAIVEKVLLSKVDSSAAANSPTLIDLYLDFSNLKDKWKNKSTALATINFSVIGKQGNTRIQDSVLYVVYKQVIKKNLNAERLNKKGSIISISTQSLNEQFSKLLTERTLQASRDMYIDIKTSNAQANVNRLASEADSLKTILNAKSYQTASLMVADANPAYKQGLVPMELTQRDKTIAMSVYGELVKQLEISKWALAQQTPVIQLLDMPKYPLEDNKYKFIVYLLMGIFTGLVLAIGIVVIKYL